jgi:hypothetical protein
MAHVLISASHRFDPAEDNADVVGWTYCRMRGVWQPDHKVSNKGAARPPKPTSKKCDHETGEDMKGP